MQAIGTNVFDIPDWVTAVSVLAGVTFIIIEPILLAFVSKPKIDLAPNLNVYSTRPAILYVAFKELCQQRANNQGKMSSLLIQLTQVGIPEKVYSITRVDC